MIQNPILPGFHPDPCNPILTSSPENHNERADWDHLKPRYYNTDSKLQKSGHASYVNLPNGETWLVHLTSKSSGTKTYQCKSHCHNQA